MSRPRVEVTVTRRDDGHGASWLEVAWQDGRAAGGGRIDHVPGADPPWLGAADELTDGADRRAAGRVLDGVAAWARGQGLRIGVWHDGEGVELLHDGT